MEARDMLRSDFARILCLSALKKNGRFELLGDGVNLYVPTLKSSYTTKTESVNT